MKQVTLNIKDGKFQFFLELIKNLDFVEVTENDWWDEMNDSHKKEIEEGINVLDNGNFFSDEEVRANIRARIQNADKK